MQKKDDYIEFEKEIKSREIENLIHFTPTINLLSIFEQGKILSRALLEKFDIESTDIFDYVEFTDNHRYDDKSFINLSIQHPNSFLFRRFREKTINNIHITWCVLKIDPKFIYEKNTLFSVTNAANSHNKRTVGISGDLKKFRQMFSDSIQVVTSYNSKTITRDRGLKAKYPTDEQAEVLIKDEIADGGIIEVCFETEGDLASGKAALYEYDTSKFVVKSSLFNKTRL